MSPNHWQKIEEVFQAALDLKPAERAEFVVENSQDDIELRREVEIFWQITNQPKVLSNRRFGLTVTFLIRWQNAKSLLRSKKILRRMTIK